MCFSLLEQQYVLTCFEILHHFDLGFTSKMASPAAPDSCARASRHCVLLHDVLYIDSHVSWGVMGFEEIWS